MPVAGLIVGVALGVPIGLAWFALLVGLHGQSLLAAPLPSLLAPLLVPMWNLLSVSLALGTTLALLVVVVHLLLVAVAYAVAALVTPTAGAGQVNAAPAAAEEFALGFLLGLNAPVNGLALMAVLPFIAFACAPLLALGGPPGWLVTVALLSLPLAVPVVNLLAALRASFASAGIGNAPGYHALVGWLGLFQLFPTAWPGNLLTALLLVVEVLVQVAVFLATGRWTLRPWLEWRSGMLVLQGAPLSDLVMTATGTQAYCLGNGCFLYGPLARRTPAELPSGSVTSATAPGVALHESGHTLLLNLLGDGFGLCNFVDQTLLGRGASAWAETLAEGMLRAAGRPWHGMLAATPAGNLSPAETAAAPDSRVSTTALAVGDPLGLDGGALADPDAHPLGLVAPGTVDIGVLWRLTARPAGSLAAIPAPTSAATSLVPDRPGVYRIELRVTDGIDGGRVRMQTLAPGGAEIRSRDVVAVDVQPGGPYAGVTGQAVALDGSASDAGADFRLPSAASGDGAEVDVAWRVVMQPDGAGGAVPVTVFADVGADVTGFEADVAGSYVLALGIRPRAGNPWVEALVLVEIAAG